MFILVKEGLDLILLRLILLLGLGLVICVKIMVFGLVLLDLVQTLDLGVIHGYNPVLDWVRFRFWILVRLFLVRF